MINIIGPVNNLGYGYTTLNILKKLSPQVAYWPMGQPSVFTQEDHNVVAHAIQMAKMFDVNAPCLRIWHQHDMAQFVGKGTRIGFPIFELDAFSELEAHHLKSTDKLFVCSHWAKHIIHQELGLEEDRVSVVPLGVDTNLFRPSQDVRTKDNATVFFNCGKWEKRKGHDILAQVFDSAFRTVDNVELWLMCDNPFLSKEQTEEWKNLYRNLEIGHKVRFIDRVGTHQEVYNIMSKVDCGVFPSRAEGWNLELLELMACGKHVITTDYSAHTEFCNEENSMLIPINDTEKAYDGIWFDGNKGEWAHFDADSQYNLISRMRSFHNDKQSGRTKVNVAGIETANNFTWNRTAKEILRHVK
jgi:glycosyltransferase involved in cell wall biosynthesis